MSKPRREDRRRWTAGQREALVRRFQSGSGTQADFCQEHGLHPATFSRWLRGAAPEMAFQEVEVPRPHSAGGLELRLASGTVLHLTDPAWLAPVLRALREAGPC